MAFCRSPIGDGGGVTSSQLQAPPQTQRVAGGRPAPRAERTIAGYLLLPRPKDLGKAVVFPLGFLLGVAVSSHLDMREVALAFLTWGVLEFLVYQARYQWNDVRGFAADQRHPDRVNRRRL